MARSEARRQKQLAKKKAKRSTRHGALKRLKTQSPAQRIAAARNAIRHCLLQRDQLIEQGIGNAAVSVNLPTGDVGIVVFLIDRYCQGVKDAFGQILYASDYAEWFEGFCDQTGAVSTTPQTLRRLLDDVVEFARSCGLSPHADYHKWRGVLGAADPDQARETFEMGRDGKPFFMSGPYDSEERCRSIIAKLKEHCGEGNYDSMVGNSPDSELLDEFEDDDDDDDWEDDEDDEDDDDWGTSRIMYYDEPHA